MLKVVATNDIPKNVELVGGADGLVYTSDDKYFLSAVGMFPGDKVSRPLVIENRYNSSYELFMKAERIIPKDDYDLLEKLNLRIKYNDETLYYGPIIKENGETVELNLGLYKPDDKKIMTAEVELDGSLTGNDYRNRQIEVNWVFTANHRDESGGSNASKTEDNKKILLYCLLAGGSLFSIILFLKNLKGSKEE